MKPTLCSLTSEGASVLLTGGFTVVIKKIGRDDYWQVFEQLKAWERGFSGDEDLVKGALK